MRYPVAVAAGGCFCVLVSLWPATHLGTEFLPQMDEGDLLYMPTTQPGLSVDAARALLQQTDRAIRQVPEVERVFGKAGRADTATDPAPLEMFETVVALKPRSEWRAGMTLQKLREELAAQVELPGMASTWTAPISGPHRHAGHRHSHAAGSQGGRSRYSGRAGDCGPGRGALSGTSPGVRSVYAERPALGRGITIEVDRAAAARFGVNVADVEDVVSMAVGGSKVAETINGRERYPISVRYPQSWRDSVPRLATLPIVTPTGANHVAGHCAHCRRRRACDN